nr:hypothetical protein Ade03nite_45830 [Actinoplanes derwentensis]
MATRERCGPSGRIATAGPNAMVPAPRRPLRGQLRSDPHHKSPHTVSREPAWRVRVRAAPQVTTLFPEGLAATSY